MDAGRIIRVGLARPEKLAAAASIAARQIDLRCRGIPERPPLTHRCTQGGQAFARPKSPGGAEGSNIVPATFRPRHHACAPPGSSRRCCRGRRTSGSRLRDWLPDRIRSSPEPYVFFPSEPESWAALIEEGA